MAGDKKFVRLHKMIETHGSKAISLAGIAPPPFPFTMVIAAAAALKLSKRRICVVTFFSRGVRFAVLGLLAIRFGKRILEFAHSDLFRLIMLGFILLCLAGSVLSIRTWIKSMRPEVKAHGSAA